VINESSPSLSPPTAHHSMYHPQRFKFHSPLFRLHLRATAPKWLHGLLPAREPVRGVLYALAVELAIAARHAHHRGSRLRLRGPRSTCASTTFDVPLRRRQRSSGRRVHNLPRGPLAASRRRGDHPPMENTARSRPSACDSTRSHPPPALARLCAGCCWKCGSRRRARCGRTMARTEAGCIVCAIAADTPAGRKSRACVRTCCGCETMGGEAEAFKKRAPTLARCLVFMTSSSRPAWHPTPPHPARLTPHTHTHLPARREDGARSVAWRQSVTVSLVQPIRNAHTHGESSGQSPRATDARNAGCCCRAVVRGGTSVSAGTGAEMAWRRGGGGFRFAALRTALRLERISSGRDGNGGCHAQQRRCVDDRE